VNNDKTPDKSGRTGGAENRLWKRSPRERFSRPVRVLASLAVLALAWCVAEFFWHDPRPRSFAMPTVPEKEGTSPARPVAEEPSFSPLVFSARKLFIPEVPVESRETSRAVVEEMLGRLRLTGILEQEGDLVAWIEVSSPTVPSGARGYRGSSSLAAPSRMERVAKGDHVLDFAVEEITKDSVKLKVAGFEATLSF